MGRTMKIRMMEIVKRRMKRDFVVDELERRVEKPAR
jgi:hypothetical protein